MKNTALATTLQKNVFDLEVEGIDYKVLSDLKTLQNKKEPYFNATHIIKQYNDANPKSKKRLDKFLSSKRTKELIEILITQNGVSKKELIRANRTGEAKGTWIHKELFLSLMIWLDAKHELAVTSFVNRVVEVLDNALIIRTEEKARHLEYTDELKIFYKRLVRDGTTQKEPFFYSTIQRKISKKASGEAMKQGGKDHDGNEAGTNAVIAILRKLVKEWVEDYNTVDGNAREDKKELYQQIEDFYVLEQTVDD